MWLTFGLSSFGDWLGLLAITATATSLVDGFAAANFALGGVLLFRLLPAIVLGPLAGAFADRFDRRRTMVVSDVLRFGLFASIPVVDDLVWLFIAQFLNGMTSGADPLPIESSPRITQSKLPRNANGPAWCAPSVPCSTSAEGCASAAAPVTVASGAVASCGVAAAVGARPPRRTAWRCSPRTAPPG